MTYAGEFLKLWRMGVICLNRPMFVAEIGKKKVRYHLDVNRVTNIEKGQILFRPEYLDDLTAFPEFDAFTRRWFEVYIREDNLEKFRSSLPADLPSLNNSVPVIDVIRTIKEKAYWNLGYELMRSQERSGSLIEESLAGVVPDNRPFNSIELDLCEPEIQMQLGRIETVDPLGGTKAKLEELIREEVLEEKRKVLRPPYVLTSELDRIQASISAVEGPSKDTETLARERERGEQAFEELLRLMNRDITDGNLTPDTDAR